MPNLRETRIPYFMLMARASSTMKNSSCCTISITAKSPNSPYWNYEAFEHNTRTTHLAITLAKLDLVTALELSPVGRG